MSQPIIGQVATTATSQARADAIDAFLGTTRRYTTSSAEGLRQAWAECDLIVSHLALGATTRLIAALLRRQEDRPRRGRDRRGRAIRRPAGRRARRRRERTGPADRRGPGRHRGAHHRDRRARPARSGHPRLGHLRRPRRGDPCGDRRTPGRTGPRAPVAAARAAQQRHRARGRAGRTARDARQGAARHRPIRRPASW